MHFINDLIFSMRRRFQMPPVGRQILAVAQGRIEMCRATRELRQWSRSHSGTLRRATGYERLGRTYRQLEIIERFKFLTSQRSEAQLITKCQKTLRYERLRTMLHIPSICASS